METPYKELIPPLTAEEKTMLEESIVNEGCREALILWGDILIDGHNRHEICTRRGIEFKTLQKEFADDTEARIWIIKNQLGRRNLPAYERGVLGLRLTECLKPAAKEKQVEGGKEKVLQISVKAPVNVQKEAAKIADVSHDTIAKVKVIEAKATPEQKNALRASETTINRVYKDIKREEKKPEVKIAPQLPDGLFDVIYADPPWRYEFSETKEREIENQYPSMELEDIKNINVPASGNAVLLMWATAPKLEEALSVMNAWGFGYKTCAVWDKEMIGMGYWFRGQHELLLVGVKGKFSVPSPENRVSSVWREKRGKHSKKPEYYYGIIERMFPNGRYLEMFCREKRSEKWGVWGNQV